jgi:hypothetical protein
MDQLADQRCSHSFKPLKRFKPHTQRPGMFKRLEQSRAVERFEIGRPVRLSSLSRGLFQDALKELMIYRFG